VKKKGCTSCCGRVRPRYPWLSFPSRAQAFDRSLRTFRMNRGGPSSPFLFPTRCQAIPPQSSGSGGTHERTRAHSWDSTMAGRDSRPQPRGCVLILGGRWGPPGCAGVGPVLLTHAAVRTVPQLIGGPRPRSAAHGHPCGLCSHAATLRCR
jgi:hypothetical protein